MKMYDKAINTRALSVMINPHVNTVTGRFWTIQ